MWLSTAKKEEAANTATQNRIHVFTKCKHTFFFIKYQKISKKGFSRVALCLVKCITCFSACYKNASLL